MSKIQTLRNSPGENIHLFKNNSNKLQKCTEERGDTERRAYGLKGLNRYIKNPDFRKLKS